MTDYSGHNNQTAMGGPVFTVDPTAAHDGSLGFSPGYVWINSTTGVSWTCVTTSPGAALWISNVNSTVNAKDKLLGRLFRNAAKAALGNPRKNGLASGVTVTANGTTGAQANVYFHTGFPGFARVSGGTIYPTGSQYGRVYSSVIAATGGNIATSDGKTASYSRIGLMVDDTSITFKVGRSTAPYRFIVDDCYVDLTGTLTVASTPQNTYEFITVALGSRGRKVEMEMQGDCAFVECSVSATGKVSPIIEPDLLRSVLLGDSYAYGSAATALGDGYGAVMADWLGLHSHANSGSSGTGWATANGSYRFDQRIANGDLGLGGTPDLIFIMGGSYNDRGNTPATITANCLSGLKAARSRYPNAPIFVLGAFPGSTGPSAGILASEAAALAAFTSWADSFSAFIPISSDTNGAWITGTGVVGTTTGVGNSDLYTEATGVHMNTAGCAMAGKRVADAVLAASRAMS